MQQKKDWFKSRGYPHFSNKTPKAKRSDIYKYISNPKKIAYHSFLPLIFKEIRQRRYKEFNFNDEIIRSHKKIKNEKVVSNVKVRPILYATHIDAHIYSYYTQKIISPKYESYLNKNKLLSEAVTAYRQVKTENELSFKNNIHFAKDVFDEIKKRKDCIALVFDIESFFPSLDHKILKRSWAKILETKTLPKDHYNIFKAATKFSFVKLNDLKTKKGHFNEKELANHRNKGKDSFFNSIKDLLSSEIIIHKNQRKNKEKEIIGIPQGLPISAILANIYMLKFDENIIKTLTLKYNVFYRRYSDDIIIVCKEGEADFIESFIVNEIKDVKLTISKEKTEKWLFKINNGRLQSYKFNKNNELKINIPLTYLGFEFYGYQTLIKSKNLAQFYREMKQSIKRNSKRVTKVKEKHLLDDAPIFKRKIYRLFSYKGIKSRKLPVKGKKYSRKFRGNYLRYAYKASDELEAPEIKRQLRNHWKILQKTLKKYDFSNVKKD